MSLINKTNSFPSYIQYSVNLSLFIATSTNFVRFPGAPLKLLGALVWMSLCLPNIVGVYLDILESRSRKVESPTSRSLSRILSKMKFNWKNISCRHRFKKTFSNFNTLDEDFFFERWKVDLICSMHDLCVLKAFSWYLTLW